MQAIAAQPASSAIAAGRRCAIRLKPGTPSYGGGVARHGRLPGQAFVQAEFDEVDGLVDVVAAGDRTIAVAPGNRTLTV